MPMWRWCFSVAPERSIHTPPAPASWPGLTPPPAPRPVLSFIFGTGLHLYLHLQSLSLGSSLSSLPQKYSVSPSLTNSLPHGPTPLNKLRDPEPRPSLQKVLCLPGVPFSPYLPVDFLPTHPQRPISTSASSKKLPASFPLFSHSILNLRYDLSQFYA